MQRLPGALAEMLLHHNAGKLEPRRGPLFPLRLLSQAFSGAGQGHFMDVKPKEFCLFVLEGDLFKHTNRSSAAMHISPGKHPLLAVTQHSTYALVRLLSLVWFGLAEKQLL